MSFPSFEELGVSRPVSTALHRRGITTPFPVQRLVLEPALAGDDVLVRSPTGSGKTLAFGLPLIERTAAEARRPSALVLAPTRELAAQIVEELREPAHSRALAVAAVYGGAGIHKQSRAAARAHILVATPGRLEDLIDRGDVTLRHVTALVLDEADRMLDMGFRPAVDRIVGQVRSERQTIVLSATLEGEAGRIARAYTREGAHRVAHDPPAERRGDVEHRFVRVAHEAKLDALVEVLADRERGRTLVFVRTKRGADRLVKRLGRTGHAAVAMHGDRSQPQREKALARFEAGSIDTLVATDVAARGIDVAGITHVVNFDAPPAREDYVHRVGRTGRAGATGVGISFVMADQAKDVGRIARELDLQDEWAAAGFTREVHAPVRTAPPAPRSAGSARRSRPRRGRGRGQGPSHQPASAGHRRAGR